MKAISMRLRSMQAAVIHLNQTYTVPGHSIFNNLYLVWDLLKLACRDGLSCLMSMKFTLLSLSQEKVFDKVDHGFLTSMLMAFGFGSHFV